MVNLFMARWIYKKDILKLIENQKFNSEKEFEEFITPRLVELFKIKPNQIKNQATTTSFDYTLSNRADIVVTNDDPNFKKDLLVIELKLAKSVEKYKDSNYTGAVKQLHKYCQDVRSLYGILLTDETCFIYVYRYLNKNQEFRRIETDRIPNMRRIEDRATREVLFDFVIRKGSFKYFLLIIALSYYLGVLSLRILQFVFRVLLGI